MLDLRLAAPFFRLTLDRPRAGPIEKVGAEQAEQRRVVRIVNQAAELLLHGRKEFRRVVRRRVNRIVAGLVAHVEREAENLPHARRRGGGRQEQQVAVAALETYFLLAPHAAPLELRAAVGRRRVAQAIRERQRMSAAADRFAMRVEHDRFQLAQSVALKQLRDPQAYSLYAKRPRHLPDESP